MQSKKAAHLRWLIDESGSLRSVPEAEPWETIPLHGKRRAAKNIVGIFSPLPHYIPSFHREVRTLSLPIIVFPPEKILTARALIQQIGVSGVVARAHHMVDIVQELHQYQLLTDAYLQTILTPEEPVPNILGYTLYEVHLLPGVVLLFQCEHLAHSGKHTFHPSQRFSWHEKKGSVSYKDPRGVFSEASLPRRCALDTQPCPCGETLLLAYI